MAVNPRRSSRDVKLKKDSNFVYDEEVFKALTGRVPDSWQQCTTNESAVF